jgi:hypothetical protein
MGEWVEASNLSRTRGDEEKTALAARLFRSRVRNDESYSQKWDYVRENPVRVELVVQTDEWPYQGEFVVIDRA